MEPNPLTRVRLPRTSAPQENHLQLFTLCARIAWHEICGKAVACRSNLALRRESGTRNTQYQERNNVWRSWSNEMSRAQLSLLVRWNKTSTSSASPASFWPAQGCRNCPFADAKLMLTMPTMLALSALFAASKEDQAYYSSNSIPSPRFQNKRNLLKRVS